MPMAFFRKRSDVLSTVEGKKAVKSFNKMAAVLMEFEILYHKAW